MKGDVSNQTLQNCWANSSVTRGKLAKIGRSQHGQVAWHTLIFKNLEQTYGRSKKIKPRLQLWVCLQKTWFLLTTMLGHHLMVTLWWILAFLIVWKKELHCQKKWASVEVSRLTSARPMDRNDLRRTEPLWYFGLKDSLKQMIPLQAGRKMPWLKA